MTAVAVNVARRTAEQVRKNLERIVEFLRQSGYVFVRPESVLCAEDYAALAQLAAHVQL